MLTWPLQHWNIVGYKANIEDTIKLTKMTTWEDYTNYKVHPNTNQILNYHAPFVTFAEWSIQTDHNNHQQFSKPPPTLEEAIIWSQIKILQRIQSNTISLCLLSKLIYQASNQSTSPAWRLPQKHLSYLNRSSYFTSYDGMRGCEDICT
jgi:hypothetical protein